MMKVLHIITNLKTGGAEKLLVDSLPRYIDLGVNVDLLLLNDENTAFKQQLIDKGVQVYSLGADSVYNPMNIFKLIPYLNKYEIVHVHLFPTLYWVSIARILSFSKIKLVFTEHSTFNNRLNKPVWKFLDKIIYSQYDKIVSISEDVQESIQNQLKYKNTSKFEVIENGILLSSFSEILKAKEKNNSKKIIVQVSSFNPQKDQETLIKAISILHVDIELKLVGDGINRIKCENLVSELKLNDRVHFLGIRNDIPNLLVDSDIVVQSSLHEGFGLAALEGMAARKPVIASDVPGLNNVVGGAGLLFEVGDYNSLASLINKLLLDDVYYDKIAADCLDRSKIYDINNMVVKYIDLYKEILEDEK